MLRVGAGPRLAHAVRVEPRVRYNPALRSEDYVVPGLFAVLLRDAQNQVSKGRA